MAYSERKRRKYNTAYVSGSAAPNLRPQRRQDDWEKEQERRRKKYAAELENRIESRVLEIREHKRQFSMIQILLTAAFLTAAVFLMKTFIFEMSDLHTNKTAVESLEKQYQELLQENTLLKNQESRDIDYQEVYDIAVNELHMSIPEKQQVIYYQRTVNEYVTKDGDIPNE